jgi:CHASE3 domain sensor protein
VVKRWRLTHRVSALCALVAIVLGGIAVTAAASAQSNRDQVRELLDRIGPLRTDSAELQTVLVDQETAVRGYALTRDER